MKYLAKPVEIEAKRIMSAEKSGGSCKAVFDDGSERLLPSEDEAEVGMLLVTWPDGEETLYPEEEFNSRFSPVLSSEKGALDAA